MPLLDALLRHREWLLGLLALVIGVAAVPDPAVGSDWRFFTWGSDALFGASDPFRRGDEVIQPISGGLDLYASYPFLQIGPTALVLAKLLQVGPHSGLYVAGAVIQTLGLVCVLLVDRSLPGTGRTRDVTVLVGGGLALCGWASLTRFGHLDDALALTSVIAAGLALARRRPVLAGVLLGAAAATKPWAVVAVPLLLALPTWRGRCMAAVAAAAASVGPWAPFVIAAPETLHLGEVFLQFSPASPLALVTDELPADFESLRLVQFGVGASLCAVVALTGAWWLAPVVALSGRLLLEPATYAYYGSAVVIAAFLADVGRGRPRLPLLTAVAAASWATVGVTQDPQVQAVVRAAAYVLLVATGLGLAAVHGRRQWQQRVNAAVPS